MASIQYIRRPLNFLLYSNIFISICAGAMSVETYLLMHQKINWIYIVFVVASTLLLYNFPVFFSNGFSPDYSERHLWVFNNKKFLAVLSVFAFLMLSITVFFFPFKFLLLFILITIPAFAYFFPQTHLRSITGLKALIVTMVWAGVTVIYPILLIEDVHLKQLLTLEIVGIVAQNIFFIFPICIAFNVRDIEADRQAGVRTFPVCYGIKKSNTVAILSLVIFAIIVILFPALQHARTGFLVSAAITAFLILFVSEKRSDYYYSIGIDGMLLLQVLLLVLFNS